MWAGGMQCHPPLHQRASLRTASTVAVARRVRRAGKLARHNGRRGDAGWTLGVLSWAKRESPAQGTRRVPSA